MFYKACMGWIEAPFQMYATSLLWQRDRQSGRAFGFAGQDAQFLQVLA
jgi:hypothetical protein